MLVHVISDVPGILGCFKSISVIQPRLGDPAVPDQNQAFSRWLVSYFPNGFLDLSNSHLKGLSLCIFSDTVDGSLLKAQPAGHRLGSNTLASNFYWQVP